MAASLPCAQTNQGWVPRAKQKMKAEGLVAKDAPRDSLSLGLAPQRLRLGLCHGERVFQRLACLLPTTRHACARSPAIRANSVRINAIQAVAPERLSGTAGKRNNPQRPTVANSRAAACALTFQESICNMTDSPGTATDRVRSGALQLWAWGAAGKSSLRVTAKRVPSRQSK